MSRYEHAERGESRLSGEYYDREQHDGASVAHEQRRFDHHAYRDEEDRAEEVLDRFDQSCDPFGCDRFGQERSHDEGAECSRETGLDGDHHHPQTQAERHDEQRFVVEQPLQPFEQRGDQVDAQQRPEDQEGSQFEDAAQHLGAFELLAHGQRREQHHQHDAHQILDHEDAQHHAREALSAQPHVVEGLEDDRRRRHREHPSQENAAHVGETQRHARSVPHEHHSRHDRHGGRDGRAAHAQQFAEREFESHGEKQEDDADVGPHADARRIGDGRAERYRRACQHAGHDVAEDDWLAQSLEDERRTAGGDEDDRQVGNERCDGGHEA